jgi:hypothetical protein
MAMLKKNPSWVCGAEAPKQSDATVANRMKTFFIMYSFFEQGNKKIENTRKKSMFFFRYGTFLLILGYFVAPLRFRQTLFPVTFYIFACYENFFLLHGLCVIRCVNDFT